MLARSLVDQDLKETSATICYFFFKDNDEQGKLDAALCAILHQLFSSQPHLIQHALKDFRKKGQLLQQDSARLWDILAEAVSGLSAEPAGVVCVIDALDECNDADQRKLIHFIGKFYKERASSNGALKFVITSRPYHTVQRQFEREIDEYCPIRIRGEDENDQIKQEINLIIEKRVGEIAKDFDLGGVAQFRLRKTLTDMEHRTYLWLSLALDEVWNQFYTSPDPNEVQIESLPRNVEEAYERILDKVGQRTQLSHADKRRHIHVDEKQRSHVRWILMIVAGARRPMTIEEVAVAFGMAITDEHRTRKDIQGREAQMEKCIRDWCGLFIFFNQSRVYLIHQTAKEFLLTRPDLNTTGHVLWPPRFAPEQVEAFMARACIEYLCLCGQDDSPYSSTDESNRLSRRDHTYPAGSEPFFQYSAEYWPLHLEDEVIDGDEKLCDKTLQLCDRRGNLFSRWIKLFWDQMRFSWVSDDPMQLLDQHAMALNGHTSALRRLYEAKQHQAPFFRRIFGLKSLFLEARDSTGKTPLLWATRMGHASVVKWLLDQGANANSWGESDGYPLQVATENGAYEIAKLLLKGGASVNAAKSPFDTTALAEAAGQGNMPIVQLLLSQGATVNIKIGDSEPALQNACAGGHFAIVRLLLDKGADVNAESHPIGSSTALQAASFAGHYEIANYLIERGANVNAEVGESRTALQAAAICGHLEIVQLLLGQGAKVNAAGGEHGAAIHAAVLSGMPSVLEILVKNGADVNASDTIWGSPLQIAAAVRSQAMIGILLDTDVEINARGGDFETALHAAALQGDCEIMQLLLDRGADLHAVSDYYGTVLHAAASEGQHEAVQFLLDKGLDVNEIAGRQWGTALQAAAFKGEYRTVQLLLEKGADVNTVGGRWGSAIGAASRFSKRPVFDLLLAHGADTDVLSDFDGRNQGVTIL